MSTDHDTQTTRKQNHHQNRARTCPNCLRDYTLGIDGVAAGCDRCEGIVRMPNGMIDYSSTTLEVFIREVKQ